jgi:transcription antitermination factor NusG
MAHSYTPGLKVTSLATIRRERKLPLPGDVVVTVGQQVTAETIVARTQLPGNVQSVNVANLLGVLPEDVEECLTKPVGSKVDKGETFAESRSFFGLFRSKVHASVIGTIESVSKVTGQVLLREEPIPVEVDAYVDGIIVEVHPRSGVTVETRGAFIQGIFGVGGETCGELHVAVLTPAEPLEEKAIDASSRGKILVGGAYVTTAVLRKAIAQGVKAVVIGGFDDHDLRQLLGYDLGVAITGSEELGITLIVTEGFGSIPMAARTFDLLRACEGRRVSVSGATQIRAGVQRPEIVAPLLEASTDRDVREDASEGGLKPGDLVRVIRQPYFGKIGRVTALPPELMPLETEAKVRVLEVDFGNESKTLLPRANVEMIES